MARAGGGIAGAGNSSLGRMDCLSPHAAGAAARRSLLRGRSLSRALSCRRRRQLLACPRCTCARRRPLHEAERARREMPAHTL